MQVAVLNFFELLPLLEGPRVLRIAAEMAEFQIVICPADLTRWIICMDTRRAVRKTRQHVATGLTLSSVVNGLQTDSENHQRIRRKLQGFSR